MKISDEHESQTKDEAAPRYDDMKLRWDLMPMDSLDKVAEVFTHGAAKYWEESWRNGMSYKRMYGPIFRHLSKSQRGEDIDPDSGCFHLSQIVWGALCLLWFQKNNIGEDDRVIDLDNIEFQHKGSKEDEDKRLKLFWDIIKHLKDKKRKDEMMPTKEEPTNGSSIETVFLDDIEANFDFKNIDEKDIPKPGPIEYIDIHHAINELLEGQYYKHFKGNVYKIICVSMNSEKQQKLVTYKDTKNNKLWTRPLDMFNERITDPKDETKLIYRFTKIENTEKK